MSIRTRLARLEKVTAMKCEPVMLVTIDDVEIIAEDSNPINACWWGRPLRELEATGADVIAIQELVVAPGDPT